jgi:molybdopterin-guanine dinucleotide biosynthesis protein A
MIAVISDMVAAVLAGGSSERMGVSKSALEIGDETFLERIVGTLSKVFDAVVVCGGDTAPAGVPLVADVLVDGGPVGGLHAALVASDGMPVFLAPGDMPLLSVKSILRLTGRDISPGQARIGRVDRRPQPLCGVYGPDLKTLARLAAEREDRSMMGFVRSVPHLTLIDIDDGSLVNINTPEQYERLIADLR